MQDALLSFCCIQDPDVEQFLRMKALDYERHGWCAVYLLLNEDKLEQGEIFIEAYFTLSHRSLIANPDKMSRSAITKYGGVSSAKTLNFVLIGQLGKYIRKTPIGYVRSFLSEHDILDYAFEVIYAATGLIPCKHTMVECKNIKKVVNMYTSYGFSFFQEDGGLQQYCRKI